MSKEYAPGPWTVFPDGSIVAANGNTIISPRAVIGKEHENRHVLDLIAAAPDMREALRKAEAALSVRYSEMSEEGRNLIFEMRTALAKARGEEE